MKKMRFISCVILVVSIMIPALDTKALTFNVLPIKQVTKQWSVEVSKAKADKNVSWPEKGKYNTYSMEIKNVGNDAATAEIQMYRNEPDSTTRLSLFGCPDGKCKKQIEDAQSLARSLNNGNPVQYLNFMLAEEATELEVDIIWTQKGQEGRDLKETFRFTENGVN
ncbi:hypothetical protein [Bacillus atrophaeus]|uniref:hypothetical protein n=1 Tax=Bacillus atrophaeus TaxID=1452 RepID=UPI00032DECAB|nr:YozF [Bacillus atrophaeus UCMB-5137]ATO28437.1 hypothetical protein RA13_10685 [Bacillus atrophaeus]MBU5263145.1 hypothetical protein [Bacillus atrophaeus]PRS10085.1 hypothetical protein C6W22_04575 [Bacillus atrophaeus]QUF63856.1 hypothetical protein KCX77_12095 [Bacillus atrophaeus]